MKRKRFIVVIVVFVLVFGGGFYFVKKMMTPQNPYTLNISKAADLQSISISKESVQTEITDMQEIEDMIFVLDGNGRTTKKESVNDNPVDVEQFIKLELRSRNEKDTLSVMYLYEENGRYYLEQPYNGIYQISGDEYNGISKYLQ